MMQTEGVSAIIDLPGGPCSVTAARPLACGVGWMVEGVGLGAWVCQIRPVDLACWRQDRQGPLSLGADGWWVRGTPNTEHGTLLILNMPIGSLGLGTFQNFIIKISNLGYLTEVQK